MGTYLEKWQAEPRIEFIVCIAAILGRIETDQVNPARLYRKTENQFFRKISKCFRFKKKNIFKICF